MSVISGNERVSDCMSSDVEFVTPESTVQEAAVLMGEIEVGALPVGTARLIVGIVSDRDILYRLVARGRDPSTATVREVMSTPVVSCRPDETLRAAMDKMAANHIRRLVVIGNGGEVVGWLTLADLSRHLLVESEALQQTLHILTESSI